MHIKRTIRRFSISLCVALCATASFADSEQIACEGVDLRVNLPTQQMDAITARLADAPFARGNHWRAERGGKSIHLIGTIHISDPRLGPVAERLTGVIEASDLLLLEAGPKEEAALKSDLMSRPELLFLQNDTLPELLPEDDWNRLAGEMKLRGIPPILASRFQPWYLSMMLGMPPCLLAKLKDGGTNGLDHRLRDIALKAEIPMQGLEPHDRLFQIFNKDPLDKQIELMLLGLETADQSLDALETVIAAYFDQRAMEAWEISRMLALQIEGQTPEQLAQLFDEFEENLLTSRNLAWIPVILEALETRAQLVVAVGAGHLGGKQGVLALLEHEGFKLKAMPF